MSDQPSPTPTNTVLSSAAQDHNRYDWSVTQPTSAVVEMVAAVTHQSPTSLPPLYEAIDPDSLDAICGRGTIVKGTGAVRVSFPYAGHEVTVSSDGVIDVASKAGQA